MADDSVKFFVDGAALNLLPTAMTHTDQSPRDTFAAFVRQLAPGRTEELLPRFDALLAALLDENAKVNLISRRTPAEEYWTLHLLDSLLPVPHIDLAGQEVLDFGTGGGLPGIPLCLLFPTCRMTLLDGRAKKIAAVKKIVKMLDLKACEAVSSRVEEQALQEWAQRFDTIVCRSVRLEPHTAKALLRLVKPGGRIVLYKGRTFEDAQLLPHRQVLDVSHPAVGTRHLVISRAQGRPTGQRRQPGKHRDKQGKP